MDVTTILAASGAAAWLFLALRGYQHVRQLLRRLHWAFWGYKKRHLPVASMTGDGSVARRSQAYGTREPANHRSLS